MTEGFTCSTCSARVVLETDHTAAIERLTKELGESEALRLKHVRVIGLGDRNLAQAQKLLCPTFGDCADALGDGQKCACGFEDGPYGNAVPPNRRAAAAEAARDEARAALKQAEACMSMVEPRSDKAEYLRILGVVRAALGENWSSPPRDPSG